EQRLAQRVDLAALAVVREVAREHLAVVDQRLVGGEQQHVARAADLVGRVLEAEPGLERDQARDLVLAAGDDLARAHQDAVALVARELRLVLARDAERALHVVDRRPGHRGDHLAGIGEAHLDHAVAAHLVAGDAQRFVHHRMLEHGAHAATFSSTLFSARSKMSKLRSRRCASSPHSLRLKSSGSFSPDRSWRALLVPMTTCFVLTTTRSPMRSGGSSNFCAASSLVSTSSIPSRDAMRPLTSSLR